MALRTGLSRPAVPVAGRGLTRQEWKALALGLALTPVLWFLGLASFYFAMFTIPAFGALQGVIVAANARSSRPLLMALLGVLPFNAVFLTLALLNGIGPNEAPYVFVTLAIITLLPLLIVLPLHFKARAGIRNRP